MNLIKSIKKVLYQKRCSIKNLIKNLKRCRIKIYAKYFMKKPYQKSKKGVNEPDQES